MGLHEIQYEGALPECGGLETHSKAFPDMGREGLPGAFAPFRRYMRDLMPGQRLCFEQDQLDGMIYIVDGWISASRSLRDGKTQTLHVLMRGESFRRDPCTTRQFSSTSVPAGP